MTEISGRPPLFRAILPASLALLGLGLLLYRPWAPVPLDMTDYSELLPVLQQGDSLGERFAGVAGYYRGHGRSNVATSGFIALNWELFGAWAVGWRLLRAAVMGGLLLATLRLLAGFGVGVGAATLGTSLLVVSRPAADSWIRLTGEPLALLALVAALGLAAGYQSARRWRLRLVLMCAATVSALLVKEIMIVTVPIVLALALCWRHGEGFRRPRAEGRDRWAVAGLAAAAVLPLAAFALVARGSGPSAYARGYGTGSLAVGRFLEHLSTMSLPLAGPGLSLSLPNVAFAAVLMLAWVLPRRSGPERREVAVRAGVMLSIPVLGALVYLPWTRLQYFYAFPFLLGSVFLLGAATQVLGRRLGRSWLAWLLVGGLILPFPAAMAHRVGGFSAALRKVNWDLAEAVARFPRADTLRFAVPVLPDQEWQGRGPTLGRFAAAIHDSVSLRRAEDITCPAAAERLREPGGGEILLSYRHWCGPFPRPTVRVSASYSYLRLPGFGLSVDTVGADLLVR